MKNILPILDFDEVYSENGFILLHNLFKDQYQYEKTINTDDQFLSDIQKFVLAGLNLNSQVGNGGFIQYFYNGYGYQFKTYLNGLVKYAAPLSASKIAQRVNEIISIDSHKLDRNSENIFAEILDLYHSDDPNLKELSNLDMQYYDVEEELFIYFEMLIKSNLHDFMTSKDGVKLEKECNQVIETYYNNGNIKDKFRLVNGIIVDFYDNYYENGNLAKRIFYNSNGCCNNNYEYYYENGFLKERRSKRINSNSYLSEFFHKNGHICVEQEFVDGQFIKLNGWTDFGEQILKDGSGTYILERESSSGKIEREESDYKNYLRDGRQYIIRDNLISTYYEMKEGKSDGVTIYYTKGRPVEEVHYKDNIEISRKRL
jgi:antitoxin component YwqK of YwqJK toxin-antitoxin module